MEEQKDQYGQPKKVLKIFLRLEKANNEKTKDLEEEELVSQSERGINE